MEISYALVSYMLVPLTVVEPCWLGLLLGWVGDRT